MTEATIAFPRILRIGPGVSRHIGGVLQSLGLARPFLMSDGFLSSSGKVADVEHALRSSGIGEVRIFCDTVAEPTINSIDAAIASLRLGNHDCVIGFGGGSVIDSAKAVAVLSDTGDTIDRDSVPRTRNEPGLPVIAIPTTAGTGSESTRFTVLTDAKNTEKLLFAGLAYLPVAALVDYELTLSMPPRLTADVGIDALTHAIEAYVSQRANQFSDALALAAMTLIAPALRTAYREPENHAARDAMMVGACQAGMAFSNSSVALVHGMSRPVGAHFHVPHGLSNAMLLPLVTGFSATAATRRYADCARAMALVPDGESDQGAVGRLIDELHSINFDLAVPSPSGFGIARADWHDLIELMADQALASGSPANNPLVPTRDDIMELYRSAYR